MFSMQVCASRYYKVQVCKDRTVPVTFMYVHKLIFVISIFLINNTKS